MFFKGNCNWNGLWSWYRLLWNQTNVKPYILGLNISIYHGLYWISGYILPIVPCYCGGYTIYRNGLSIANIICKYRNFGTANIQYMPNLYVIMMEKYMSGIYEPVMKYEYFYKKSLIFKLYTRIGFKCFRNREHCYWNIGINHQILAIALVFTCTAIYEICAGLMLMYGSNLYGIANIALYGCLNSEIIPHNIFYGRVIWK